MFDPAFIAALSVAIAAIGTAVFAIRADRTDFIQ